MIIGMTCKKCNTRLVKSMSKQSYEHGVVLIRCNGCKALHLVADHLGWFEDGRTTIEDIARAMGQQVTRVDLNAVASAAAGTAGDGNAEAAAAASESARAAIAQLVQGASKEDLEAVVTGVKGMRLRQQQQPQEQQDAGATSPESKGNR